MRARRSIPDAPLLSILDRGLRAGCRRKLLCPDTVSWPTGLFNITLSEPKVLAKAYRDYHRYRVTIRPEDAPPVLQERDVLIAGKVVVVIPIDVARQEIVLIRQFRLPALFANGHGYLVEFVAGRVEPNETLVDAARRECREEIGVAPEKTVELLSYLSTPGLTDEEAT